MALKGDRNVLETDISFFINVTSEKGSFFVLAHRVLVLLWIMENN